MRIISCASYYGTGSSAITDLLSEYQNCYSFTDYEFRFIHDPDGISDLEYNLVENHNRLNSGHALKRYQKLVKFYSGNKFVQKYEPFFNNQWLIISSRYIDQLTTFKAKGWWFYDLYDRGLFCYYCSALLNKLAHLTIWKNKKEKYLNVLPNEMTLYSNPSEEEFLKLTRNYIDELIGAANIDNKENVIVDQIVPPSNLKRYNRYFNNLFVFVVERDPRDLYLLEKYVWNTNIIPVETPELFCKWYIYTRSHRKKEDFPSNTLFIYFEDLVYKYEKTVKKIEAALSFNSKEHINEKKHFNPDVSKKNTRLWIKFPESKNEIELIENNLKNYLYDYSFLLEE